MKNLIHLLLVLGLMLGCAGNLTSKYDDPKYEGCLICDIASKRNVRLEDVGNAIRIGGLVAREMDVYTAEQAIEVLTKIRKALDMPISGASLLAYVGDLQAEYVEVLTIAMSYATDFAIPQILDEKSVGILTKFIDERIAVLKSYAG